MKIGKSLLSTHNYFTGPAEHLLAAPVLPCSKLIFWSEWELMNSASIPTKDARGSDITAMNYGNCCLLLLNMILSLHMVN